MSLRTTKFHVVFRKGRWRLRFNADRTTPYWWENKRTAEGAAAVLARRNWEINRRPSELVVHTKDDSVSYTRCYGSQKERARRLAEDRRSIDLPPLKDTDPSRVRGHLRSQNIGWNAAVLEMERMISRRYA